MKTVIQIVISGIVGAILGSFLGGVAALFLFMGNGMGPIAVGSSLGTVPGMILMVWWAARANANTLTTNPPPSTFRQVVLWFVAGFVVAYFTGSNQQSLGDYRQIVNSPLVSAIYGAAIGIGTMGAIGLWRMKYSFSYKKAIFGSALGMLIQPFLYMALNMGEIILGALLGGGSLYLVGIMWQRLRNVRYGKVATAFLTLLLGTVLFGFLAMIANYTATNGAGVFIPEPMAIIQISTIPLVGIPLLMYGLSWFTQGSRQVAVRHVQDNTA
jgi:hypothetical protein